MIKTARYIRAAAITLALTLALCAFSCSLSPRGELFGYLDGDLSAKIKLTCNGSESELIYREKDGVSETEFLSPSELCGFSLRSDGNSLTLIYDGLCVAAPEQMALIPSLLSELFSLKKEDVSSVSSEISENGEPLTRLEAEGITVLLRGDGSLYRAEGQTGGVGFTAEITELSDTADGVISPSNKNGLYLK